MPLFSDSRALTELTVARHADQHALQLCDEVVALFERWRSPLLRYLNGFRIPAADAEEIVQEVFLLLFLQLRQNKRSPDPQGWIFRTAHHFALKHRTRSVKRQSRFHHSGDMPEWLADQTPDPLEQVTALERRDSLRAVVRALPEKAQWCLSLRASGLRYREISDVLGISLGSVASLLERSVARLARTLERGGLQ